MKLRKKLRLIMRLRLQLVKRSGSKLTLQQTLKDQDESKRANEWYARMEFEHYMKWRELAKKIANE